MKAILNKIMSQTNLTKIFRLIYEKLTIISFIISLILICLPIIFLANRKLTKSKDILDSDKDIQERNISKKNMQEPTKEIKGKKENESQSKILSKIIDICICKKKKQKVPSQLQLGELLREEGEFQIIEVNKLGKIIYIIRENKNISSKKENNDVKSNIKDNIMQDNNIISIIETKNISQSKENKKKEIIKFEEKEKIESHFIENKNEDDINKKINEKKEIKDNEKAKEEKHLKLIKEICQNNIEKKKR